MAVLAGIDFFTVEVLTWRGLAIYYVLFFVQLESRRVHLAGMTKHPDTVWMEQMARNAVDPESGYLRTLTLCSARPRYQVLRELSIHSGVRGSDSASPYRRAART